MAATQTCPVCNAEVAATDRFCNRCGADILVTAETVLTEDTLPTAATEADPRAAAAAAGATGWAEVLRQLREVTRGRFEVERELGHGGMAAVYLAHEVALDRKVALKVMSPAILMQPGMVERFRREAVTIAGLRHPNIVTVHGVEHHGQLHFFVLEFVEGRSLEAVLQANGPLPISVVNTWFAQVGAALDYAHRRGIVHRDVKPGNILLDLEGNAIVTDFGIAKVEQQPSQTATGMVMGTPAYMSPEQCLGNTVAAFSDQYSLGVVVYEMLTGAPPFTGSSFTVMHAHAHDQPPLIGEGRPDCPAPLAQAVARMLEKEPEKRWASLRVALDAAGSRLPGPEDPVHRQLEAAVRGEAIPASRTSFVTPETPLPRASPDAQTVPLRAARRVTPKLWLSGVALVVAIALWLGIPWLRTSVSGLGGPDATATASAVASLIVAPAAVSLILGDTARLQASAYDTANRVVADRRVSWRSSDTLVATVAGGLVMARSVGEATITASSDGVVQSARVVVTEAPALVSSIDLNPRSLRLEPGAQATLQWNVLAPEGATLNDRVPTLASDNLRVATVSSDGVVRAVGPGSARITATIDTVVGEATVTVLRATSGAEATLAAISVSPPTLRLTSGGGSNLTAQLIDTRGNAMRGAVSWQSTDSDVVSVTQDGRITAVGVGTARVSASSGDIEGHALVTVDPVPVGAVEIEPDSLGLVVGESAPLSAVVSDPEGRPLPDAPVVWRSTDEAVAAVTGEGIVNARGPGTALITASSGTVVVQTVVTVAAALALDADAAAAWADGFIGDFVEALNSAMPDRDMAAIRQAWRASMSADDEQQWSEFLSVEDFRDFSAELTAWFEPERVSDRWRTDFEVQITFRHSRGSDTWEQEYRVEYAADSQGVAVLALGLRSQRR
jgi:uncharacterized protein YjdB/tRNA A-37 threonylcarbamoyl transferase component Bud32